jgi:hypothetical protein
MIHWLICQLACGSWLLREQITFSPASPVPIKGYFCNFVSRTILASATNGAGLIGIGQLQRAHCFKNIVFVCIYACTGFSLSFIPRNNYACPTNCVTFGSDRSIIKGTYLGKQTMFSYVFPLQLDRRS